MFFKIIIQLQKTFMSKLMEMIATVSKKTVDIDIIYTNSEGKIIEKIVEEQNGANC